MNAAAMLARLDGVRRSGKGWIARCPAHADKSPSLSIAESDDGRVLIHCFAGCPAADVVAAIGLDLAALFPRKLADCSPQGREAARAAITERDRRDAATALRHEAIIVAATASELMPFALTGEDYARLVQAQERIAKAAQVFA